ncbi:MAG: hypothetical protein ACSHXD_11130 [Marinosulfonomonas sp.]
MTDVIALEQRITIALDRIGNGLGRLSQPSPEPAAADPDEVAALQAALEGERVANAQLEERVKAIKVKQESVVHTLEAEVTNLRQQLSERNAAVEQLKSVNGALRDNNKALREANAQGLGDVDLINNGMVAELEALRTTQESDRAELESILVELKPLVEGNSNA